MDPDMQPIVKATPRDTPGFTLVSDLNGSLMHGSAQGVATSTASLASNAPSFTADVTPPALTLDASTDATAGGPFTVTATFSEEVEGMTIDAVEVTNGTADTLVARSPSVCDFDVRPTGEGPLSIAIASSVARDAAGNPTVLTVMPDLAGPDVTLTGPDLVTDVFTVTVAFSEPVRAGHYRLSDSFVTNGAIVPDSAVETAGDTGAMTGLTFRVDPQTGTVVAVELPAGTFIDMAGNSSTASNRFTAQSGSPASEFARAEETIRAIVREEAKRDLNSTTATNRRMTRQARTRFIRTRRNAEAGAPVGPNCRSATGAPRSTTRSSPAPPTASQTTRSRWRPATSRSPASRCVPNSAFRSTAAPSPTAARSSPSPPAASASTSRAPIPPRNAAAASNPGSAA